MLKHLLYAFTTASLLLSVACLDLGHGGLSPDGGEERSDLPPTPSGEPDAAPGWGEDPPADFCGPEDVPAPPLPGGTAECPDDKNLEGCPCDVPGQQAECWPGLRADRGRGICQDGVTTCVAEGEHGIPTWSECQGAVLPVPGATLGAEACACFSSGQWELDNLSPCFATYSSGLNYSVSTFINDAGQSSCPTTISATPPPAPQPGKSFTTNRLTVDCAGQFELCYTIKAGDAEAPSPADCVLATVCVDVWYAEPNVTQELPPLPSWTSPNSTCAAQFMNSGGYGEMTVQGESVECESIDDGSGGRRVFNRVPYCPLSCNDNPSAPECEGCTMGGAGSF